MSLQKILDGRTDLIFEHAKANQKQTLMDQNGIPLIRHCAYYGDVSAIRYLLSIGENLQSLGQNFDLNGAVFHGHWQLCQFLIESGADVNLPLEMTGETPLHTAFCKSNRPVYEIIVDLLLINGANPNTKTKASIETENFMRDCKTKAESPLHRAAAYGNEKSIQLLLDSGASKEAKDMNGETPLSWASFHLRPPSILRKLCYGPFKIHQNNNATYDHGQGWHQNDYPMGKPN